MRRTTRRSPQGSNPHTLCDERPITGERMHEILGILSVLLLLGGMACAVVTWRTRPRGERVRCPGPARWPTWLCWAHPRAWLWRGRCWYQLTGHVSRTSDGGDDAVHCPECGGLIEQHRLRRDGRRFRTGTVATTLLLSAGALWLWPAIAASGLIRPVPTLALVALDRVRISNRASEIVSDEVQRRVRDGAVDHWSASIICDRAAGELCDDEVKWNADRALDTLSALWPDSQPALERILSDGDAQARILAASMLRWKCPEPSQTLLDACIEDLRDDRGEVAFYIGLHNASSASRYLITWAYEAKPQLKRGMQSSDAQQRLLSAAIVGHANMVSLAHEAAPILIEHLRDNKVRGDAKVAAPALYQLGPAVIPWLRDHTESDDEQLRSCALAIIERLERPDEPAWKMTHTLPRITMTVSDPLQHLGLYPDDLRWPVEKARR